jgi:hypothetical protein
MYLQNDGSAFCAILSHVCNLFSHDLRKARADALFAKLDFHDAYKLIPCHQHAGLKCGSNSFGPVFP